MKLFQCLSSRIPMPILCRWIMATLTIFFLLSPSHADPIVSEQETFYDIYGSSEQELRDQMRRYSGILGQDGQSHDASAFPQIEWSVTYGESERHCWISKVTIRVQCTYKFPRWMNRNEAPAELREKWDTYISRLRSHEHEHRNIAVDAAAAVEKTLMDMGPRRSCDELAKAAGVLSRCILENSRQRQIGYDVQTDHGRLQGVHFP